MKKKRIGLRGALLGLLCAAVFSAPAMASWRYEVYGPGSAAWINEQTQETVSVFPGTAAPDGSTVSGSQAAGNADSSQQTTGGDTAETAANTEQNAVQPEETQSEAAADKSGQSAAETSAEEKQQAQAAENPNLVMSNGRQLDLTKPMVALTYDDGPFPAVGNLLMDELAKVNGRATFFMVGNRVAGAKEEVQRMVREGHEVANHSWDHQYFNKLGAEAIRSEVAKTNEAIAAACGVTPTLMRLPGGNINATVRANVNMPMIYWSIDTLDWKTKNAQKTIDAVVGKVKDGDIVLMHEIWKQTGVANQTIIPALAKQGFQLVTVSELAKYKGHTLGLGQQYSSFR